eukprot:TRINITY_DN5698_c0_g1_i3.p1 TRINITY_DN5698_c0_g1~~TRINITY_DN5698_c0_g1_i3.p1  ORF type:complete len:532 (-),score=153.55 TRINITY_DN5698_c0_g1_i3:33-1628(-)
MPASTTMPLSYIQGVEHKPVSRIVFGTLNLHKSAAPFALLDSVYASGCNAFDCAAIYGDGECEKILGNWIKANKINTDDLFLVTKGGCGDESTEWSPSLQRETLEGHIRSSLDRLQVPTVDLYMLHRDDPALLISEIVDTVNMFISSGLCKTWGVSNWDLDRIDAAISYANKNNLTPPVCDSLQFSLAVPHRSVWPGTISMDDERNKWYTVSKGISVFAWESLAKGFMTGSWGDRDQLEKRDGEMLGGERDAAWRQKNLEDAYLIPRNFDRRDRAVEMAQAKSVNPGQIAISYVLAKQPQAFVLIGTSNPDHWAANVEAASIKLSPEEVLWLEDGGANKMRTQTLHCLAVQDEASDETLSACKRQKICHVEPPSALHAALPASQEVQDTVACGRASVLALAQGQDDRLMVLIGPCSIHSPAAAIEYARWLLPLARKHANELVVVMRVYFEKPRTTVGWKGLVSDPDLNNSYNVAKGLKLARALLLDLSLIHISEPTRLLSISYAVFCLKKKKKKKIKHKHYSIKVEMPRVV